MAQSPRARQIPRSAPRLRSASRTALNSNELEIHCMRRTLALASTLPNESVEKQVVCSETPAAPSALYRGGEQTCTSYPSPSPMEDAIPKEGDYEILPFVRV
jgi:hypothetical protein